MASSKSKKRVNFYTAVTERAGVYVTAGQIARIYHRYYLAKSYTKGCVLEVACGPGIGIGYIADKAQMAIGGDYSADLLRDAVTLHHKKIAFVQFDAQQLPFSASAFDLIFCFEAVYYFPNIQQFVTESYRLLKSGGRLLFNSLNNTRGHFTNMPLAPSFLSLPELYELLANEGFKNIEFFGAFPLPEEALPKLQIRVLIRRGLAKLNLLPSNIIIRNILKRATRRNLQVLKPVEARFGDIEPIFPINPGDPPSNFMFLYATATR